MLFSAAPATPGLSPQYPPGPAASLPSYCVGHMQPAAHQPCVPRIDSSRQQFQQPPSASMRMAAPPDSLGPLAAAALLRGIKHREPPGPGPAAVQQAGGQVCMDLAGYEHIMAAASRAAKPDPTGMTGVAPHRFTWGSEGGCGVQQQLPAGTLGAADAAPSNTGDVDRAQARTTGGGAAVLGSGSTAVGATAHVGPMAAAAGGPARTSSAHLWQRAVSTALLSSQANRPLAAATAAASSRRARGPLLAPFARQKDVDASGAHPQPPLPATSCLVLPPSMAHRLSKASTSTAPGLQPHIAARGGAVTCDASAANSGRPGGGRLSMGVVKGLEPSLAGPATTDGQRASLQLHNILRLMHTPAPPAAHLRDGATTAMASTPGWLQALHSRPGGAAAGLQISTGPEGQQPGEVGPHEAAGQRQDQGAGSRQDQGSGSKRNGQILAMAGHWQHLAAQSAQARGQSSGQHAEAGEAWQEEGLAHEGPCSSVVHQHGSKVGELPGVLEGVEAEAGSWHGEPRAAVTSTPTAAARCRGEPDGHMCRAVCLPRPTQQARALYLAAEPSGSDCGEGLGSRGMHARDEAAADCSSDPDLSQGEESAGVYSDASLVPSYTSPATALLKACYSPAHNMPQHMWPTPGRLPPTVKQLRDVGGSASPSAARAGAMMVEGGKSQVNGWKGCEAQVNGWEGALQTHSPHAACHTVPHYHGMTHPTPPWHDSPHTTMA